MNVLLINPPRHNELIGKNPGIVEKHRGFNPPLGVLSLAGYLQSHSAHHVEVFDAQPGGLDYPALEGLLKKRETVPDVIGITAMTFTLIDVVQMIRCAKRVYSNAIVVLGGPHTHIFPEETIAREGVDFLVLGEGEIVFKDLLNHLGSRELLKSIKGLVFEDKGKIINTGIAESTPNLDELGIPARHLVNVKDYSSLLGRNNVVTTMFTSRGCPYRCTFCDRPFSPVISGFRYRSAKHVADEMEQCIELGIDEAFIYDDTFTVRKDRVFELCEEIHSRKLKFRWDVRAHVNTVTREMLKAMRGAGCDRIHYGVESGNDRMLKVIKKNATIERIKNAVQWTKEENIEVLTYFIIGQQTETISDIGDTIALAKSLNPNYAHFTVFCPYPATEIYAQGLEREIIKEDVWKQFALNPIPGFELPVWEENFSRAELKKLLVRCYKEFYLRPGYILRSASRMRSMGEISRKARAGLSVITMKPNQTRGGRSIAQKVREIIPHSSYDAHH